MPHRIAIISMLALFIAGYSNARGQWTGMQAEGYSTAVYGGVTFPTQKTGYAIGSLGGTNGVFKTTDGGTKWTGQGIKDMWLFGISFLDEKNGFVCGRWNALQVGVILRTTDGGASWTPDTIFTHGLYTITFPTKDVGYACGYIGTIVKTTDGGRSWSRQNTGTETEVFTEIFFPTVDTGYAVSGKDGKFYQTDQFYRTIDGGGTWERLHDFEGTINISDSYFTSGAVGYLVGLKSGNMVLKTTDAGMTWDTVYRTISDGSPASAVDFSNSATGCIVGANGLILRTTDAGESWANESFPTESSLLCVDAAAGFALGSEGLILRRNAAGASVDVYESSGKRSVTIAPNPFQGSATVRITDADPGSAYTLVLYDALGNEVRRIRGDRGIDRFELTSDGLAEGVYLYRLLDDAGAVGDGKVIVR